MDIHIQRALNDKLYDKRKVGALEYVFLPSELSCRPDMLVGVGRRGVVGHHQLTGVLK
jgi:hypothetical protein